MNNIEPTDGDSTDKPKSTPSEQVTPQPKNDSAKTEPDDEDPKPKKKGPKCWRQIKVARKKTKWHDIVLTIATVVIAGTGFVQCIIYLQMKYIMHSSGEQTERLISAQKKIANLQYIVGSPNVRFSHFNLYYYKPTHQIWGWIRVKNFGTNFEAQGVQVAANLQFRKSVPNDYKFSEKYFQSTDRIPIPKGEVASIVVGVGFDEKFRSEPGIRLYSWGRIRYLDIGGDREEKTFCRVIKDVFWSSDSELANSFGPYKIPTGEVIGGIGEECPPQP
jgi:hypothetical protein